ncbi:MAG: glycyl-radical enzyme activating protein [Deltaproteobacteria bacterium]|jgi:pyruvate formate lyase activating enzyme|nr:glycyl-radical enzyme activating protein [Deltaproteobacteria bacterium]
MAAKKVSPAGTIFQIQRWSLHDGEGIRSTVFMKGCPLRCQWCANPESWTARPEAGFGFRLTVDELVAKLRRDAVFYRESGGGVTFSGGEPLAQPVFLRAALEACGEAGFHRAIETGAYAPREKAAPIFDLLEEIFVDIKHMSSTQHKALTGKPNAGILRNIGHLLERHDNVTIRVPLVTGLNDDEANIKAMCSFLHGARGLRGVEFMSYHNLGVGKYARLGLPVPPPHAAPAPGHLEKLKDLVRFFGLTAL